MRIEDVEAKLTSTVHSNGPLHHPVHDLTNADEFFVGCEHQECVEVACECELEIGIMADNNTR